MTGVMLPRSREQQLELDGRIYRVFLAWPAQPPPPAGYPLFYVLDANAAYATVVEAIRMRAHRPDATAVGPAVVIGIAYPGDEPYHRARRTFDYTPPRDRLTSFDGSVDPSLAIGGRETFLAMITGELTTMVAREFPIDRTQRTIIGHSLAGFFVLHTLVTSPGSFDTYVAISPSIWWDRQLLVRQAKQLPALRTSASPVVKVMVTVGEYEQSLAPWQQRRPPVGTVAERRVERRMIDHARELAELLADVPRARVRFEILAGQDHASVVPLSISEALRFAFPIADGPPRRNET
jgi:predicted alpha/beta superfamily hydrolase